MAGPPPAVAPGPPTHAGGVVVRTDGGAPRMLVVSAKRKPDEWVLPKGHIEAGETPAETAIREVREESGVTAVVEQTLGLEAFVTPRGPVRAEFFLMRLETEGEPDEPRRRAWLTLEQAFAQVSLPLVRDLMVRACERL